MLEALERLAPLPADGRALEKQSVYHVWQGSVAGLQTMEINRHLPLSLILTVDQQKETLLRNTENFAAGYAANNALLWGCRGAGKSTLVKSVCAELYQRYPKLCLVEIGRADLDSMPELLGLLSASERRGIVFCDDLSFEPGDEAYKSLKSILDGGLMDVSGRVLFYATSNRRHLLSRDMSENAIETVIHGDELRDEHLSLTDRFGLWIGFHHVDQDGYLAMIAAYASHFSLDWSMDNEQHRAQALQWSRERGGRSGRVAWQYINDIAGRQQRALFM